MLCGRPPISKVNVPRALGLDRFRAGLRSEWFRHRESNEGQSWIPYRLSVLVCLSIEGQGGSSLGSVSISQRCYCSFLIKPTSPFCPTARQWLDGICIWILRQQLHHVGTMILRGVQPFLYLFSSWKYLTEETSQCSHRMIAQFRWQCDNKTPGRLSSPCPGYYGHWIQWIVSLFVDVVRRAAFLGLPF